MTARWEAAEERRKNRGMERWREAEMNWEVAKGSFALNQRRG